MSSILVCLVISSISVRVTSFAPKSSVVMIGSRMELNCSVNENDSRAWTYTSWNSSTERSIYLGENIVASMRSRYRIDKTTSGKHNLIIDSVDLTHAGRYRCISIMQQSLMNDIQLTVLDCLPMCFANISSTAEASIEHGHYLWIWCLISYTGKINPTFTWSKDNTDEAMSVNTTASNTSGLHVPSTTISSVNRHLQSDDNGATFKCKITFQLASIHVSDENTTDYEYTWSYALYGPCNISIIDYEDHLECSADGNPTPTYRWTSADGKSFVDGPVLIVNNTCGPTCWPTSEEETTFLCIATNVFGSERRNFSTPTVFTNGVSPWSISTVGLVLIITSFTVLGIVLLGIGLRLTRLSNAFDKVSDKAPADKPSFQLQQPSMGPTCNSPVSTAGDTELHGTDATENYCALTGRPTVAHEPQLYCELRSLGEESVKSSPSKQKAEQKDCVYANVGLHETQM